MSHRLNRDILDQPLKQFSRWLQRAFILAPPSLMARHQLTDIFRESDAYEYPGGHTRFVSVTDESMSIRRTWDPGIAIGVRGITLEVDAVTGEVLRAGPMGLALRQMSVPQEVLASDPPATP